MVRLMSFFNNIGDRKERKVNKKMIRKGKETKTERKSN